MSPHLPSTETVPNAASTARRTKDLTVPLTLPSRKSSQHLCGGSSPTETSLRRPDRLGSGFGLNDSRSSRSVPVSPQESPRIPYSDDYLGSLIPSRKDEEEIAVPTPSISRRSSFIYMNGANDHPTPSPEPPSYFLPMPQSAGAGLGFGTPTVYPSFSETSQRISRAGSSVFPGSDFRMPHPGRRVTMPRMLSTSDWSAAAKAKDKSIFGLMVDSLPVHGASRSRNGYLSTVKAFARWLWKTRDGVVLKSWREAIAVAWPSGVVWIVVNALFFLG